MRKLFAFLVWLFSFWTFFLRWLWSPAFHPASGETAEHLPSQEGQQESDLARFLSSLPEDGRKCRRLCFFEDSEVRVFFGRFDFTFLHGTGTGVKSDYGEFLEAIASSEIVFCEVVSISLRGDGSCKHVEAFADALRQSGNRFRKLKFACYDGSAIRFAKCLSSVLLQNEAIQQLHLKFSGLKEEMGKEVTKEFITIIAVPRNLQILKSFEMSASKLDGVGMEQLMKPFQSPPNVLEELLFYSLTSDVQFEHISGMFASSTSLKSLKVYTDKTGVKKAFLNGYNSIATGLCSNQSLEFLSCNISNSMELKVLLDPLLLKNNNLQCNTTLTKLRLWESIGGKEGIETLVHLIHTNTTILELRFCEVDDLSSLDTQGIKNVLAILEALKTNKSLTRVGFYDCKAVGGYKVLGAMMDLLLENHNIEDIDLRSTGLSESGDADYVYSALSKRKKMKLWDIVRSMAIVNPTSGRVFLCGEPFAGKTRLRMSMKQLKEFQRKDEIPNQSWIRGKLQNIRFKKANVSKVPMEDMPLERTHGIEVESVLCDGITITIWDMAGQTDYHSFHELVMPNLSADGSSSMFLLMCNPMMQSTPSKRKCPSNIKLELESWLRFIASNTRRSLSYRPHVSIVMTHFDYWKDDHAFVACIDDEVLQLKSQFQEVLEFDEDKSVFKVDGRDVSHARGVFDFMKSHMKRLLERLPKTIKACEEVQRLVALWNADKSKPPLLKWEEFCEGMCKEVEELNDVDHELAKRKREFVAISLNDGGHVIYNEKGVVITNPHWFCHHIIGQFLHQCAIVNCELEMVSTNGIISMKHMKHFICNLVEGEGDMVKQFDDILGMMIKLHICYEQDATSVMIPSTLKDKHESLSWSSNDEPTSLKYVGRRLACKDGIKTMLTPGFFTRLQVSFFNKLQSKNAQDTYQVFRDIIKFISGGIEVILQFHHGDIDILLRSHQCQDKMLEFLENGIVMHIKCLQEDMTLGCPGVHLTKYILRPKCVQNLIHAKERKNQCVQVKDLEVEVTKIGVDATYNWKSCEGLDIGYNKVSTLLGSLAWKNLLERRSRNLQDCHKKIQSLGTMIQNDQSNSNIDKDCLSTTSFWQMPQRLIYGTLDEKLDNIRREHHEHHNETMSKLDEHHKETMSKLDDMVHLIQNLEYGIQNIQGELLPKVCSKIDDLMAFSIELQKSQIPKLAYLCEFGERKLLTRLVPDLDRIQLHLMCESIYGFHEVVDQEGCIVYFGTKHTRRFLAMVAWGFKIATILTKIGAHVACGMGSMVPDISDGGSFVALILDTPGFLDYQLPTATLESLPSDVKKHSRISIDDQSEAQRWLQEFLEPKCQNKRDFYEKFRLKKVRHTRARGSIAWMCDRCILVHHNEIDELG